MTFINPLPFLKKIPTTADQAQDPISRRIFASMVPQGRPPEQDMPVPLPMPLLPPAEASPMLSVPPQGAFDTALNLPPIPPQAINASNAPPPQLNRTERAITSLPKPELPDHSKDKKRGFWANFGHRLEHIGKGALLGAARGGLGGMLYGGIAGGVKPEFADRLEYNTSTLPQWLQQRKIALDEAGALDEADRKVELSNLTQAQIANLDADNQRQTTKDRYDLEQKRSEALAKTQKEAQERIKDSLNQRANLTKEGGEFIPSASQLLFGSRGVDKDGKRLPAVDNAGNIIPSLDNKGFYRMPSQKQEQERKLALEREKGKAELELDIQKRDKLAPGELDLFEEKERIRKKYDPPKESPEDKERRATIERARGESRRVQVLIDKARSLDHQSRDLTDAGKADKEKEAQAAWDAAEIAASQAAAQYPEYIKGGAGNGGYAFVDFQEPKGAAANSNASSSGTLSKQAGNYKAGDVVKYKGQRHRILRFENGNPVLDPNPIQ